MQVAPVVQSYALMPLPPINNGNQTLFGENQYYTVTFRGNGEAIVTMKAIISNTNTTPLSSVTLHIPSNITSKDVLAYQVIAKPQCIQYSNQPIAQPNCLQYQQPDYQYVANDTTYQKISIDQTSSTITLPLPTPIKANETGSYLLSFRTFDYTQKNMFAAYTFTFHSLKVDDQINTLQVGIATDSDLFIKNATSTVNYNSATSMKSFAVPQAANSAVQSQQFNDFYNQLGQGTIVKNASNLEPLESYTTTGMYADTGIKLYGQEITITVIAIIALLIIVFGITFLVLRRQKTGKSPKKSVNMKLFFIAAGTSFGSVLLASGYTIIILLASTFLNLNNSYGGTTNMFVTLLITALSGAVYLFLLFVPAIIMTVKKGFVWGGIMLGLTIMWAIIASIILFGVFYLFANSSTTPNPIIRPLMMSSQATPPGAVQKAQ